MARLHRLSSLYCMLLGPQGFWVPSIFFCAAADFDCMQEVQLRVALGENSIEVDGAMSSSVGLDQVQP